MTESIRLLLVDDEERFVETLSKRLKERGLDVTSALSGTDALKVMSEKLFDVVVLDVKMPGMDGAETLREIKRSWPLVEVIMLTGHASVDSAIEGMRLGAFEYLMKPIEIEVLMSKVEEAHEKKSIHEEKIQRAEVDELIRRRPG
jgi:DNA-binding NtrC family response regulator